MFDSHHPRFMRGACRGIALAAVVLLQPATLAFATTTESSSGAFEGAEVDAHYRRCEWTPKKQHCYWVQSDSKIRAH